MPSDKSSGGSVSPTASGDGGDAVALKRNVGLFSSIGMIAGLMIGSGIFVSPVGVVRNVGSVGASLIVWVIGGAASFVGATCYTELGTMLPQSGGDYQYIGRGFGGLLQFLYMWAVVLVVHPGNRAVVSLTFATYVLKPVFPTCDPPSTAVILLAAFMIVLLTVINCINVRWVTRLQDFFMVTKCLALVTIIVAGVVMLCLGRTQNFDSAFEDTSSNPAGWAKAVYSCVFTYAGWNYLNAVAEEVKDPAKTLPRGLWISIPLVTFLYCFANFAFFVLLTPTEMMQSTAVAVTFGNKVFGVMSWIVPVFVACSTFGGLNGLTYMPSRLYFVAARNGQMPSVLHTVNMKFATPIPSLIVQCIVTLVILSTGEVLKLIGYVSFVETCFVGISVASLVYLRFKEPDLPRPVKVNLFFPFAYLALVVFLLALTLYDGATEALIGIGITLTGVPVYVICVLWKKKPASFNRLMVRLTRTAQKLLYSACEKGHSEGGDDSPVNTEMVNLKEA